MRRPGTARRAELLFSAKAHCACALIATALAASSLHDTPVALFQLFVAAYLYINGVRDYLAANRIGV